MTALILQHGDKGPPGVLGDWAAARGIELEIHHAQSGAPLPALNGQAFIASLGSPHNPADLHIPEVAAELAYVEQAIARDIPVLGLCFGGQMLAKALGGEIEKAPHPELGWHAIDSAAPEIVPPGPWLQWHFDRFTVPIGAELLGATEIARTQHATQAFRHGRHLGVQFHPESTIEIVRSWARSDDERVRALGIGDGQALLERGRSHATAAASAAFDLFDAFWRRTRA
jgi:GMP synthase-like glutamine amidotransferase